MRVCQYQDTDSKIRLVNKDTSDTSIFLYKITNNMKDKIIVEKDRNVQK